jgi:hypothetical protein
MKNSGSGAMLKDSVIIVFVVTFLSIAACKKEGAKTEEPPKTLTKSLLYDKEWLTKNSTIAHKFNSNGTYYGIGTWKWLNNSDTMEIKITGNGDIFRWHFKWNTEHEFTAHLNGKISDDVFKDYAW